MRRDEEKEAYRGGVETYRGPVPVWLIVIYVALALWSIFYVICY